MLFCPSFPKRFFVFSCYFRNGDVPMAKATSPYLSEVRGSISKRLTFRKLKPYDTQLIQSIPVPSYRRTPAQDRQRTKFLACKNIWNQMDNSQKEQYRSIAEQLGLTPYQSFMSCCLSELILYDVLIDNTQNPNDLVNFQVPLEITNDQQFFRDCNYNKNAISFMTEDLKDPVPYYIEYWNPDTKSARIWLKVPLIKASSTTTVKLLIIPSKQTTESDPEQVFEFFDDFDTFDTNKWEDLTGTRDNYNQGGVLEVSNSELCIGPDASANNIYRWIQSKERFGPNVILELRGRIPAYGSDRTQDFGFKSLGTDYLIHSVTEGAYVRVDGSYEMYAENDGARTSESVSPPDLTLYRIHKIEWGQSVKFYIDNDLKAELTSNIPDEPQQIIIGAFDWGATRNDARWYVDWVRVRKFTSPEPTVTYRRL